MATFDVKAARALAPGQWLIVPDAPGLRLVATETRRTWIYRYRSPADDRMRQVRLGAWPAMPLAAALAAWSQAKQARDAGQDLAQEKRQRRRAAVAASTAEAYTVRRMCDDYLAQYRGTVVQKTYAEAERLLRLELDAIADIPAGDVTRAQAWDLIQGMRGRPVLAQRVRQLMGAATDLALDAGRLQADTPNWWRLILRGKLASRGKIIGGSHQGSPVKRVLSEDELRLLLPWLPNFSRDIEDALRLMLWTGSRGAEVVAMCAEEVSEEPDGWWWTVPRSKLKMRRNPLLTDLRVHLYGDALAVVKRRLTTRPAGYLFASRGKSGHIEQKALGVAIWCHMPGCTLRPEWVRPRLPVVGWAAHDLRRTARTMLASLGCPLEIAEAILGHIAPGVVGVYDRHSYDAERRLWLQRLADRLRQLQG